ncbi:MAG: sigma-70 family RNA polymerase sigma factor [Pirellulaceae bacterium]|jgi:RNA polymerase sigma-70 factor (ECF subfamily)|nr:sigma-70 family RNA polymerase sigma factor [Pirellulaceae bacterium]MDP7016256.1 sigma-70 family RNA polymerase sigma factor [Pirellulaceae bacterium]
MNDADLVLGLRQGDRDAWEALCQQYSDRLWRYVARLVGGDEQSVTDVFQETIMAAASAGRRLGPGSQVWPWLARIGHNQAALFWRKRYRDADVDWRQLASTDGGEDPAELLERLETVDCVRCLLAAMSADQVALLTGKYLDGLTAAELATQLGGTTEAIRSRLARARREFRERFERLTKDRGETHPAVSPDSSPQRDLS